MRFSSVLSVVALFCGFLYGTVLAGTGALSAPPNGAVISEGESFSYNYGEIDGCHQGFTVVTVWLVSTPPTLAQLNSSGEFSPGDFLYFFGQFATWNFPTIPPPPIPVAPPPSSLVMPDLGISAEEVFFTVVETSGECDPPLFGDFTITFNNITYEST
ncbi:hypothetical protein OBBRIDRAFT_791354 [Obba rivulosa]|uniref:Uncharacterized protein n=1 Tax=Obba rivulosa TaxID=1052685 RepID=A0A8E2B5I0_9APHY|nr:hypothetical protein OBBRIDRAFT_791354 [Obba rivulosa]